MIKWVNKKNLFFLVGLLIVSFISLKVYRTIKSNHRNESDGERTPVNVIHAIQPNPKETITLPGNLKAWYEAPIYAQVSGYVKMWYKDYGAEVEKGDVLAEVQAPALDAEYAQVKAEMDSQDARYQLADITADRYLALRQSQAVSEQSISVAVADKKAEKAKLMAALKNVHKYQALVGFKKIVAPFKGIVTQRNINVGDYVNKDGNLSETKSSANLFTVSDIHKMRLFVSVPGTYAYLLKPGFIADVNILQFGQKVFKANFLNIANGFDANTQTVIAQFTIDNEDRSIWPGSYATVSLTAMARSNLFTIPTSALVFDENGTRVATVTKDNRVHFKPIRVNKVMDTVVEVLEGVSEEDVIINNPKASFLEGDLVTISIHSKSPKDEGFISSKSSSQENSP